MSARSNRKLKQQQAESSEQDNETRRHRLEVVAGDAAGSVPALDGVIHERARLAILTALATGDDRSHTELRDLLGLTDGNLSVHARKLEEAEYVTCSKEFAGRTPRTTYRLTDRGRKAFERYIAHLESLISAIRTTQ